MIFLNAISFKNHNFCCLGGGRSKKISWCRGSSPEVGWAGFWPGEGGCNMESWNASSTPCCQRWKNEVFLINYFLQSPTFPFLAEWNRALTPTQYEIFTFFALCYKLAKKPTKFCKRNYCSFPILLDQTFGHFQTRTISWDLFIERSIAQHPLLGTAFSLDCFYHRSAEIVELGLGKVTGLSLSGEAA